VPVRLLVDGWPCVSGHAGSTATARYPAYWSFSEIKAIQQNMTIPT